MTDQTTLSELLSEAPRNWGRWGPDDEVGALNFLTGTEVLRGVSCVRTGEVFTLQVPIGHPHGDPGFPIPSRIAAQRFSTTDKGHYERGDYPGSPGGLEGSDDVIFMSTQGSTQYDALGHIWYDDQMWNGYPSSASVGGMQKASVLPIAEKGIVGRGVLLDIARHRGKEVLDKGETFTHLDLLACAEAQGVALEKHDILVLRTGFVDSFYRRDAEEFYRDFVEPGLTYSPELVEWFHEMEIPNLVTDTIANETTADPVSGCLLPLHAALMRNLGIAMTEIASLDALASSCATEGRYDFLYAAGPLKIARATGAPVNPLAIR